MEQNRPRWWRVPLPVNTLRCGFVLAIVFAPMTAPAPTTEVAPRRRTIKHLDVKTREDLSLKLSKVKTGPLMGDNLKTLKDPLKSESLVGDSSRIKTESWVGDLSRVKTESLLGDSLKTLKDPLKIEPSVGDFHVPDESKPVSAVDVIGAGTVRMTIGELDVRQNPIEERSFGGDTFDIPPITRDTIYVYPDQRPGPVELKRVAEMASEFIARVPHQQMPDGLTNGITFVVVSRGSDQRYWVTICDGEHMRNSEHFVGKSVLIGGNASPELLASRLKELAVKGTVFAFGDNDGGALEQASRKAGLDFVRRGPSLKTDLLRSAQRNAELANRSIDPEQVSFFNGLPATEEGLEAMRFPTTGIEKWQEFHRGVEGRLEGRFATRLTSKKELLEELRNGSNDIVTIVAHNDGKTLFINGEELTYGELDGIDSRVSPSERPRLCILISCEAVKISDSEPRSMLAAWRKNRESFAELLVRKGFVDRVFAPDHEIQYEETLKVLDHVKSAEKVRDLESLAGWIQLAELLRKVESEPI